MEPESEFDLLVERNIMKRPGLHASRTTALLLLISLAHVAGAAERAPLDTNKDGAVDFAELQARRGDLTIDQFNAMDQDRNGQLNPEELRAARSARMQARAAERFKSLDTNGDGQLSQQELAAPREQAADERFKRMDTDGNGQLSQAEMEAARAQAAERMRERRDRRGPPPG